MRITRSHLLTMASAALLCGPLAAQESEGFSAPSMSKTELKPGDVRASNLLGAMVKRLTGDSIGEVEDLIVSADADIRLAVISVGGILGLGAKTIALPFDQFTVAPDGSAVYLTISEEELRARPAFDLDGGDGHSPSADEPATPHTPIAREQNELAGEPAEGHAPSEDSFVATQQVSENADPNHGFEAIKSKATRQPTRALVGAEVVDIEKHPIGRINDLVVTAEPAEVQVVLELLGGESAASSRFVAVPLGELTIARGHGDTLREIESVEMSLTASQLEVLPTFEY